MWRPAGGQLRNQWKDYMMLLPSGHDLQVTEELSTMKILHPLVTGIS